MADNSAVPLPKKKILFAYSDSEEEQEVAEIAEQRIERKRSGRHSRSSRSESENNNNKPQDLVTVTEVSVAEEFGIRCPLENAFIPEDPVAGFSRTKELSPADVRSKRRISEWMSDEETMLSDSELVEPPPPARPKDFMDSSRSPTPAVSGTGKTNPSAAKFPRIDSQSLVSYGPDEEDLDESITGEKRRKSKGGGEEEKISQREKTAAEGESAQAETATASSTPATTAGEEVDAYALLDSCFEKQSATAAESSAPSPGPPDVIADFADLPPEPKEPCSAELENDFREFFIQKFQHNMDYNAAIQTRKDFRNPSIYEKLIEHFGIDELGSNFRPEVYDPHGFQANDFYDEIGKTQRIFMEKIEKEKPSATSVAKDSTALIISVSTADDKLRRKSKWDNPDVSKK